jgi:hypothetical protein
MVVLWKSKVESQKSLEQGMLIRALEEEFLIYRNSKEIYY